MSRDDEHRMELPNPLNAFIITALIGGAVKIGYAGFHPVTVILTSVFLGCLAFLTVLSADITGIAERYSHRSVLIQTLVGAILMTASLTAFFNYPHQISAVQHLVAVVSNSAVVVGGTLLAFYWHTYHGDSDE